MNANTPSIILNIIDLIRNNQLANKESLILDAIDQGNENINYLIELSTSCAQFNKLKDAELILKCLGSKIHDQIKIYYNLGLVYSLGSQYQEAVNAYDLALKINPEDVDTLVNASSARNELKQHQYALKFADNAIHINPRIPEAWVNRGNSLCGLSSFEEAVKSYQEACRLNPQLIEAWLNQNLPLNQLGRHHEAITACDEAIRLQPNSDVPYSNKGITLNELGRFDQALMYFERAICLNPNLARNFIGKGITFHKLSKYIEAIAEFDKAIALESSCADAFYQKSLTLGELKRYNEAIDQLHKAIAIDPKKPEYWFSMGAAYLHLSETVEAELYFNKALDLNPDFHSARWAKVFCNIPSISTEHNSEVTESLRSNFLRELQLLDKSTSEGNNDGLYKVIGSFQPFYLAYQNINNKELLGEYGRVCEKIMRTWQLKHHLSQSKNLASVKIKVGIVSNYIYDHSVWNAITKGLLLNLDTSKFEVHVFYLGTVFDAETSLAKSKASSFSSGATSLLSWAKLICEKNIEALIYPEIGMHQLTTQLASLRLASLQMAAWGHPETTGLPTIDYYLSGELYEPKGIDAYTETLIKLPNLASCYYPIPITSVEPQLKELSFACDTPILLCPGTPFKYDPKNDWILVEIAKRLGKCKLVFFQYHDNLSNKLKFRLQEKFEAANLSIDEFILFIPWLNSNQFHGLMSQSSVFLDTIGFSGFNTAIQAIECALPIVTKDGEFMRGRLASGLLKRIGLSQLVATNEEEYIELVIKLVNDKSFSDKIKQKMREMRSSLYEDASVIRSLEDFLLDKLRNTVSSFSA